MVRGPESERHVALDGPSFNKILFEGLPHPDERDHGAKKKTLWKEIWELSWKSLWFLNKNKGTREGTEGLQYIFMMQPQTQLCPLPSVSQ